MHRLKQLNLQSILVPLHKTKFCYKTEYIFKLIGKTYYAKLTSQVVSSKNTVKKRMQSLGKL